MRRGTTPTLLINVKGVEVDKLTSIILTLKQGNTEIDKENVEVDAEHNRFLVELTQEETLLFEAGKVATQFRGVLENGRKIASNIVMLNMNDILMEGVIE